jgi:hypothetical protein
MAWRFRKTRRAGCRSELKLVSPVAIVDFLADLNLVGARALALRRAAY